MSANALDAILNNTSRRNSTLNITGLLVYNNGNFLQILEGNYDRVYNLYAKIITDDRHDNIIKLIDEPLETRIFDSYEVGFMVVNNMYEQKQLKGYLDWLKQAEIKSVDKVIQIVENFIQNKFIDSSN